MLNEWFCLGTCCATHHSGLLRAWVVFARRRLGQQGTESVAGFGLRARHQSGGVWWYRGVGGIDAEGIVCQHARDLVLAAAHCRHSSAFGGVGGDRPRVYLSGVRVGVILLVVGCDVTFGIPIQT